VPVISAPQKDEALEVLERVCHERGAPLTLVGRELAFEPIAHSLDGQSFAIDVEGSASGKLDAADRRSNPKHRASNLDYPKSLTLSMPLLGRHQVVNAVVAYAALKQSGLDVSDEAIRAGFAAVRWPARFEIVRRDPPVIFDSAHNQDSFARLYETLELCFPGLPIYLIFGASEDKNIPGMFAEMKPKIKRLLITRSSHPRALPPEQIVPLADQAGLPYETVVPVEAAFGRALELSKKDGSIVLSAGSMFVTADVMKAWQFNSRKAERESPLTETGQQKSV
jgi:dihydrofolate synthase/folylpolyglutamate synthase